MTADDQNNQVQNQGEEQGKKAEAQTDADYGKIQKITGSTIGGAGGGPGTGETGGNVNVGGPEADNDWVSPDIIEEDIQAYKEMLQNKEANASVAGDDVAIPPDVQMADPGADFPGGGAVSMGEDRIPPANQRNDDEDFNPESPLNDRKSMRDDMP
jgi:hypothetical protein